MRASELRIGNYVKYRDVNYNEFHCLTGKDLFNIDSFLNHADPIVVTSELLLRFGFVKDLNYDRPYRDTHRYKLKSFGYYLLIRGEPTFYPSNKNALKMDAYRYVHQLQNLYFAIYLKELTFK